MSALPTDRGRAVPLALFPAEDPSPVFRVANDGLVLYANSAAENVLAAWMPSGERRLPPHLCETVSEVIAHGSRKEFEFTVGDRAISFNFVPISQGGYVNVYGRDVTERRRADEALRQMSVRLMRAQEEERRRLARELHDSTAQKLAGLIMTLGRIRDALADGPADAMRALDDGLALAEDCSQELRTVAHLLHPPLLEELGFEGALDVYLTGFTKRSGIKVTLQLPQGSIDLPWDIALALFRVVQESLGNIHRHSGSQNASIQLTRFEDRLVLEIADGGCGIPAGLLEQIRQRTCAPGVGIASMQERLRQLGGELKIESPSSGTIVRAIVPIEKNQGDDIAHLDR